MSCKVRLCSCPIGETPTEVISFYNHWLAEGNAAEMGYLSNHLSIRANPEMLLPGARTIVAAAFPFPAGNYRPSDSEKIASYALGSDYHEVVRNLMQQEIENRWGFLKGEWRVCVDTAPIFERFWAVRTGLATPTDSGMVAVRGMGTACFITLALTDLDNQLLNSDPPDREPLCSHCGACRRACPTGSLKTDGHLDARKCLSYLTIEHRGDWLSATMKEAMATPAGKNTLFGCDRCVAACPLNRPPFRDYDRNVEPLLSARPKIVSLTAEECLAMEQPEFSALFKGSAIKRAKLQGLKRNAFNCLSKK